MFKRKFPAKGLSCSIIMSIAREARSNVMYRLLYNLSKSCQCLSFSPPSGHANKLWNGLLAFNCCKEASHILKGNFCIINKCTVQVGILYLKPVLANFATHCNYSYHIIYIFADRIVHVLNINQEEIKNPQYMYDCVPIVLHYFGDAI